MKTFSYKLIFLLILLCQSNNIFPQDYWTRLNGPFGSEVIDLKKSLDGNFYALRPEGVYISSNNADSWSRMPDASFNTNLCMDISPSGVVYVGKSSGGIWWTPNNGQSWNFNPIHIAPHSGLWSTVIVSKINPEGHIYINSYASFNGGSVFNQIQIGNPARLPVDYAFSGNLIYAATNNGIYFSDNNGSSWTIINGNLPSLNVISLMFDNNILFAGTNGNGIYRTTDNGSTWSPVNNGITDLNISKVYRDWQNNYFAGTFSGKVFRSVNAGASWNEIYSGEMNNNINTIFSEPGAIYLATSNTGILKSSDNGATWHEKNINLYLSGINTLAFSNTGEIFSAGYNGIQYSFNNGQSWQQRNGSLPSQTAFSICRTSDQSLLAGIYNSGIYRSSDNGISWIPSSTGISHGERIRIIKSSSHGFLFAVNMPGTFVDTLEVYRSQDNGLNWVKVLQPQSAGMEQFTIDDNGNLFVAGFNNVFQKSILVSTDDGNTWNENLLEEFFSINNLTAAGNEIYLTNSDHIYYSTDLGNTWNQISNGSWQTSGFSAIGVNSAGHIFACVATEVYVTTNRGVSWTLRNSGITQNARLNNFIFSENGYLFGITYYDGIFRTAQSTLTSSVSVPSFTPDKFDLEQNYPNPFNPATVIRYQLAVSNFTTLKVFDILGSEVATLVNEKQNPGNYTVEFNGSSFPSGIYFYEMKADNFRKVMKMILIK